MCYNKCLWCKESFDPTFLKTLGRFCSKECRYKYMDLKELVNIKLDDIRVRSLIR